MRLAGYSDTANEFLLQAVNVVGSATKLLNLNKYGGEVRANNSPVWTQQSLNSLSQLSNAITQYISAAGAPVQSVFGRQGNVTLGTSDVTNALGYTPVQQGTGIGQSQNIVKIGWSGGAKLKVTVDATDLGNIATEGWVQGLGYLTSVTQSQVINAIGYTPYDASNPAGYLTFASANATYAPLTGAVFTGDVFISRAASPTTGVIFFGNSAARYLFFDGTNYQMPNANLLLDGGRFFSQYSSHGFGRIFVQQGGSPPATIPGDFVLIW
jgi:hypothetical protein